MFSLCSLTSRGTLEGKMQKITPQNCLNLFELIEECFAEIERMDFTPPESSLFLHSAKVVKERFKSQLVAFELGLNSAVNPEWIGADLKKFLGLLGDFCRSIHQSGNVPIKFTIQAPYYESVRTLVNVGYLTNPPPYFWTFH